MKRILFALVFTSTVFGDYLYDSLKNALPLPEAFCAVEQQLPAEKTVVHTTIPQEAEPLLFKHYPLLKEDISYRSIAQLPTPVKKLQHLSSLADSAVYMKFDGLTARISKNPCDQLYGGNKVRKLEFLIADALAHEAPCIMTLGSAGSNHCLATATYSHESGIPCYCYLKPQPKAEVVCRNLLLHITAHTHLRPVPAELRETALCYEALSVHQKTGRFPYVIPYGGSSSIGLLGFVNAAFELEHQIAEAILPEPDYIIVAIGSGSSFCGLNLGLKLTSLKTKVIGVPIEPIDFEPVVRGKLEKTNQLLHHHDPSIPLFDWHNEPLSLLTGYEGDDYGSTTRDCLRAIAMIKELEEIELDSVYTGKAMAALLDMLSEDELTNKTFLFWNTFCGLDFSEKIEELDYHELPHALHAYFE